MLATFAAGMQDQGGLIDKLAERGQLVLKMYQETRQVKGDILTISEVRTKFADSSLKALEIMDSLSDRALQDMLVRTAFTLPLSGPVSNAVAAVRCTVVQHMPGMA